MLAANSGVHLECRLVLLLLLQAVRLKVARPDGPWRVRVLCNELGWKNVNDLPKFVSDLNYIYSFIKEVDLQDRPSSDGDGMHYQCWPYHDGYYGQVSRDFYAYHDYIGSHRNDFVKSLDIINYYVSNFYIYGGGEYVEQ